MATSIEGGPTRPALFIEQDSEQRVIRRRIVHACEQDRWFHQGHRQAAIREAWDLARSTVGAENMQFIAPAPVTLYCDPRTGAVRYADIRHPGESAPRWIDPLGRQVRFPMTDGLVTIRTSYMHWAEGPLPYMGEAPHDAPDPLADRNIQYIRNQNSSLRAVIDSALAAANDKIPQDVVIQGWVDFRVRGYFSINELPSFVSKQTNQEALVKIDGQMVPTDQLWSEG